jgi:hypothetical protein
MTNEEEYRDEIQRCSWDDLLNLWKKIEADNTPGWEPGKAFEYLVLRAFQIEGAYVEWPYTVTMGELTRTETGKTAEQIDGFIHTTEGLACLVECKDSSKVGKDPIDKLRSQLLRRPSAVIGIVFSQGEFTDPAALLALFGAQPTILLWSGDEVKLALQHKWFCKGLIAKYRWCATRGLPDYHISRARRKK